MLSVGSSISVQRKAADGVHPYIITHKGSHIHCTCPAWKYSSTSTTFKVPDYSFRILGWTSLCSVTHKEVWAMCSEDARNRADSAHPARDDVRRLSCVALPRASTAGIPAGGFEPSTHPPPRHPSSYSRPRTQRSDRTRCRTPARAQSACS